MLVEVKTTDAYRINLDTVAGYRDDLVRIGKTIHTWKTSLTLDQVSDARAIRSAIEKVVPVGRTGHGGKSDRGAGK